LTESEGLEEAGRRNNNNTTPSRGKIMLAIFFDKDSSLLTEYLIYEERINGPSYALFIDWLHAVILEKYSGKVKR
jgi:hypothetical protein